MKEKTLPPTAMQLFLMFVRINSLTLGGGYVIVPVMANSLEKKGWMEEKEFYDIFARAQAFPGPLALTSSMLVSIKLCGMKGALAAFAGTVLPPFVTLLLVGGLINRYGELPSVRRFLEGAGAVVPGFVAAMLWKTASKRKWNSARIIETGILAVILILLPAFSLPVLLLGILVFYPVELSCKRCR
jgi:chromate transporter